MNQQNLTQNNLNNQDNFGVKIHSEVYSKDYDEVGFEPIEDNSVEDNPYEIPE